MRKMDLNPQGTTAAGAKPISAPLTVNHKGGPTGESTLGAFGFEPRDTKRKRSKNWQGFTCPKCEGSMRAKSTGRANDGKAVVRTRQCDECGFKCATIEVTGKALEGITSVERFDPEQKFAKKMRRRNNDGRVVGCGHERKVATIAVNIGKISGGQRVCDH